MAEPNKLRVTRSSQGIEVLVSNAQGQVKDITAVFREIAGSTSPSGFTNTLKMQVDASILSLTFAAIDKQLNYTLPPEIARQLFVMA